jgi:hypothetical protein
MRSFEAAPGGPGAAFAGHAPPDLGRLRAPQAAAGAQQADRFQQVGLAHPVLAGNRDDSAFEARLEGWVGSEIGEPQAREAQRGEMRLGQDSCDV